MSFFTITSFFLSARWQGLFFFRIYFSKFFFLIRELHLRFHKLLLIQIRRRLKHFILNFSQPSTTYIITGTIIFIPFHIIIGVGILNIIIVGPCNDLGYWLESFLNLLKIQRSVIVVGRSFNESHRFTLKRMKYSICWYKG